MLGKKKSKKDDEKEKKKDKGTKKDCDESLGRDSDGDKANNLEAGVDDESALSKSSFYIYQAKVYVHMCLTSY
jgi:hypothetical protein